VLTGKYDPGGAAAPDTRAGRGDKRMLESEFRKESLDIAQQIKRHAESRGTTAVAWATAWVLANTTVSSVLAGPRTLQQWQGYLAALDFEWGREDEEFLDRRVPAGHPSTPGFTDPRYPLTGRMLAL
jgi:aryl-alcohol dehydrogenase-like predicted oxidoreductase